MTTEIEDLEDDLLFFKNTLEEDTNMFARIRDSIKKTGDMFLFGKPSATVLNLILKLYHENIFRILTTDQQIRFMTGIVELKNGDIYMAISEDPEEDPAYELKVRMLASLLKQANVEVFYPEKFLEKTSNSVNGLIKPSILYPTLGYNWRTMKNNTEYNPNVTIPAAKLDKDKMFIDADAEASASATAPATTYVKRSFNYDSAIWSLPLTVNIVHSNNYLNTRKTGYSFVPYKKKTMKRNKKGNTIFECNNGSTCSEAKLFSYIYNNLKLDFADIKGYAAYWIDNKLPPDHIIPGYCFSSQIAAEKIRLDELTDRALDLFQESDLFPILSSTYPPEKFRSVFQLAVQPLALPCPGCFANYYPYTKKIMSKWDDIHCIRNSGIRAPTLMNTGGKKKKKKSNSRRRTKRLKHLNKKKRKTRRK
jgi:hypothetical protein